MVEVFHERTEIAPKFVSQELRVEKD